MSTFVDVPSETKPIPPPDAARPIPDGVGKNAIGEKTLTVDGKTWEVPNFDQGDFKKIEAYLRKQQNPAAMAKSFADSLKDAPPDLKQEMMKRLFADLKKSVQQKELPREEVEDFLDTLTGTIVCLWAQLARRYPTLSIDEAQAIFEGASRAEAMKVR